MVMEVTGGREEEKGKRGNMGRDNNTKGHLWGHMETYYVEAS